MRILCIGDSLGLPREECPYESTWFYRLKEEFVKHEFIDFFDRGLVIKDALARFDTYYQYYKPEIVIIQTGVVDCAPRYINERKSSVKVIIRLFQKLGCESIFWKIVKLRNRRPNCVFTKYEVFQRIYDDLIQKFISLGVKRIIVIKIGHVAESTLKNSPFFNFNVDKYNQAISQICERNPEIVFCANPLDYVSEDDFVDGYHCNPSGMDKVYTILSSLLSDYATIK